MKRSALLLVVFVSSMLFGQSFPAEKHSTAKSNTGVVVGRVIRGDTGAPLGKVRVFLAADKNERRIIAISDADGRYGFTDVDPGWYAVCVDRSGFYGR